MDGLVILHLIIVSFWFGAICVEILFELVPIDKASIVILHKYTDRLIEVPTIILVSITGLLLWQRTGWSADYLPKVIVGLLAVFANVMCYYFVEKRQAKNETYQQQTKPMYWVTAPGVTCFLIAFYLGGTHAHWW